MKRSATSTNVKSQDDDWHAIELGCQRGGRTDATKTCFAKVLHHVLAMQDLANQLARKEQSQDASQFYEKAWQQDHKQVGSLHLVGDALIRCGQEERGKELQQKSRPFGGARWHETHARTRLVQPRLAR